MANVIVRTVDNHRRTPAEVKRLLREIAFVLQSSRGIRLEILGGRLPLPRPAPAACAA